MSPIMNKYVVALIAIVCLFLLLCCSYLIPQPTNTPIPENTDTPSPEPKVTATVDYEATESVINTAAVQAAQTNVANSAQAYSSSATAQASSFYATVQQLYADKAISSTEGTYYQPDDFSQSWAQIDWFRWWDMNYSPDNFVVQADITYDTASRNSNWNSTGCGFVFRNKNGTDENDHHNYRVSVNLDGYIVGDGLNGHEYFDGKEYGKFLSLGKKFYGRPSIPSGNYKLLVAADKDWISVYLNGKQYLHHQDKTYTSGNLAFTLNSGTNAGTGTTCKFTHVELWVLP